MFQNQMHVFDQGHAIAWHDEAQVHQVLELAAIKPCEAQGYGPVPPGQANPVKHVAGVATPADGDH